MSQFSKCLFFQVLFFFKFSPRIQINFFWILFWVTFSCFCSDEQPKIFLIFGIVIVFIYVSCFWLILNYWFILTCLIIIFFSRRFFFCILKFAKLTLILYGVEFLNENGRDHGILKIFKDLRSLLWWWLIVTVSLSEYLF